MAINNKREEEIKLVENAEEDKKQESNNHFKFNFIIKISSLFYFIIFIT